MLEIPRNVTANIWMVVGGVLVLALAAVVAFDSPVTDLPIDDPVRWGLPGVLALLGVLVIASNARLVLRHPPCLRASDVGVWFGGGPIIPWQDIASIYESGGRIERYGFSVKTSAITLLFHRKRTTLKLPWKLWLNSVLSSGVTLSVIAATEAPAVLVCQLEAMRIAACGHEAGTIPGASELPRARLIPRA